MRLFLLALPFWLWGLAYGDVLSQEGEAPQTPVVTQAPPLLTYVVVYEYPGWQPLTDPLINLRVVVAAENEGDAIFRSVTHLQKSFGGQNLDRLKFIEVAQKKK